MNSPRFETIQFDVSWDNIQAWILSGLMSMAKGKLKDDDEILSMKLDYQGGYVAQDKVIPIELIKDKDKGVQTLKFG